MRTLNAARRLIEALNSTIMDGLDNAQGDVVFLVLLAVAQWQLDNQGAQLTEGGYLISAAYVH